VLIGCTRQMPEQPVIGDIKLSLPSTPHNYNYVSTDQGKVPVLYEDGSLIDNKKATIGRVLFYDKALSFNNSTACASCHIQEKGFSDIKQFSAGFEGLPTKRNSMPISNLYSNRKVGYFWDTRETKIESMVFAPIQDHIEMGFSQIDLITEKIGNLKYYQQLFKDAYGDETITTDRMRESLAQFLFSIVNVNSKFDKGIQSGFSNFNQNEMHGMELFVELECDKCHFLHEDFSMEGSEREKLANIGLEAENRDKGKDGLYRIPDLRNISRTAPYMHDGRFKTLNEVINHYGFGVQNNTHLSDELKNRPPTHNFDSYTGGKKNDILAFLRTLDDESSLTDPKFSSPFAK
jgi:cytochrome c peroxidase